jgi:mono/diheme cytochrome c family protein
MKAFSERQAFLAATLVASLALGATLGIALIIQPAQSSVEVAINPADAEQGRHLFLMNCAHCHGDDARGDEGPDLHDLHKSDARIHQVVTNGIKGEMPSFAKKLKDPDIRALTAYLRTLRN